MKHLNTLKMKERKILLQERLELKSAWNHSLAVTRLPNEILIHIFVYFCEWPKGSNGNYPQDDETFIELGLIETELMKLTFVCRRWHHVALATLTLWRTISAGKTSSWMKLALMRSGNATIDVLFPSYFSKDPISLLIPHYSRLRSLRLQSCSPFDTVRIMSNKLLALETLEIDRDWHVNMKAKEHYTHWGITRDRFPNLRALRLVHNIIPEDSLFYAQLRKLSLKACRFQAMVYLGQFVQILATSLHLEYLELDEFLQDLPDSGNARPGALPLPSLLALRLYNHAPSLSARFLSRVIVPPTTSLSIKSFIPLPDEEWNDNIVGLAEEEQGNTLRAAVPTGPSLASALPGLTTVTRARLTIEWDDKVECFSTQTGRRPDGSEALILEILQATPNPLQAEDGLADLVVLLGSAPLAHLEIIGRGSRVGAEMWARVFQAFPLLVSLDVSADGALFDGLHEASLASPPDSEGQAACQGLERIYINDLRTDRGNRLKELCMAFREELVEDVKTYLPRLEELVAKVELV
ncbi:hypothetical protein V8D89_001952 [Ganoderma adspersum]